MDPDIYALPYLESTLYKEHTHSLTIVDSKPFLRETASKQTCRTALEFCLELQCRIISYWTWILQQNWKLRIGFAFVESWSH